MGIGQLVGAIVVGVIAASAVDGITGYGQAFFAIGLLMALLILAALGLRGQAAERAQALAASVQVGQ